MAAKVTESPLDITVADADNSDGQDGDKREDNNMSLERKDSLKSKTLQKRGHLRVKEDGKTTYKRTSSQAIMAAIQLGIGYSVGRLSAKQERDILMHDFNFVEKVWFPGSGSRETPSHRFVDFKFKSYAPSAFRYFRDLFGMLPSDFLVALSNEELREVSNAGASGSMFFLSADDNFIIKTVQHKEATFLQQLLPGYYMNLHQNPRTLLPKFFGLYCYQSQNRNIRLAVMNNILPTTFRCHQIYDLKGSTFKRKASKKELTKKTPTKKDLDFRTDYPEGINMDTETYEAVVKTIRRDCRVLESFKIMDYSLLLGIHNVDQALREKNNASTNNDTQQENPERIARRHEFTAALEAIQIDKVDEVEGRPLGGIPAKSPKGDRLILFLGIIDILQSYRLAKKLEHGWKSFVHDGDSVSVHNPSFYADRFVSFLVKDVFKIFQSGSAKSLNKKRSIQRQHQSGTSSTTGTRSRSQLGGSFSEPLTPKSKDGKTTKTSSVKFAEPYIDQDKPSDEMIPPPYEPKALDYSLANIGDEAVNIEQPTQSTKTVVVETKQPVAGTGSVVVETMQPVAGAETVALETKQPVAGAESVVVETKQPVTGGESVALETKQPVAGAEIVVVKTKQHVADAKSVVVETKQPVAGAESVAETSNVVTDTKQPVESLADVTTDDKQLVANTDDVVQHSTQSVASTETITRSSGHQSENNDVRLTSETSYDVIRENHTVTVTTTEIINVVNGEEEIHKKYTPGKSHVVTDHVIEGHVVTDHVIEGHVIADHVIEEDAVLAANSKQTIKLADVKVEIDNDKNDNFDNKVAVNVVKNATDCEEVTTL